MPTFATPEPLDVTLDIGVGDLRVVATDRTDTVVDVLPSDATKRNDVLAAEQTRIECAAGRLLVKASKSWKRYVSFGDGGSIDVRIQLPTGSKLDGRADMATVRATGRLGDCRVKTGYGDVDLDEVATLDLHTGAGRVHVVTAGESDVSTGSGDVRLDAVTGTATVKNSNGDTRVGEVSGDVRVRSANGSIEIGRAHAGVSARTAHGEVRLGEVARGTVSAQTASGALEIGIRPGTAAWLDLHTHFGNVRNGLDEADDAAPGEDTVEVVARSGMGDITIRRSTPTHTDSNTDTEEEIQP